jgi:hypothetical protein
MACPPTGHLVFAPFARHYLKLRDDSGFLMLAKLLGNVQNGSGSDQAL